MTYEHNDRHNAKQYLRAWTHRAASGKLQRCHLTLGLTLGKNHHWLVLAAATSADAWRSVWAPLKIFVQLCLRKNVRWQCYLMKVAFIFLYSNLNEINFLFGHVRAFGFWLFVGYSSEKVSLNQRFQDIYWTITAAQWSDRLLAHTKVNYLVGSRT